MNKIEKKDQLETGSEKEISSDEASEEESVAQEGKYTHFWVEEKLLPGKNKIEPCYFFELGEPRHIIGGALAREALVEEYFFVTHPATEVLWRYDESRGYYRPNGHLFIKSWLESLNIYCTGYDKKGKLRIKPVEMTTHFVKEVIAHVKRLTIIDEDDLSVDTRYVNLANGILDLESMDLNSHNPEYYFTSALPVKYNPEAQCPGIEKFLSEILAGNDINRIKELAGYFLHRDYPIQTAFMFVGEGSNGKSTLLQLLAKFVGPENIASVTLPEFYEDRFARARLYQKLANLAGDIPKNKTLGDTGVFKMMTGGDFIEGQEKFKPRFRFRNYAKMVFLANELPYTSDRTLAFWRRWILIQFPNRFEKGKNAIRQDELLAKITTEEELSGFLNLALAGLRRLMKRGYFEEDQTTQQVQTEWAKRSDSVRAFIDERCEISPQDSVPKSEIYSHYVFYCQEDIDATPIKERAFGTRLKQLTGVIDAKKGPRGNQIRVWKGIRLKKYEPEPEEVFEEDGEDISHENGRRGSTRSRVSYPNDNFDENGDNNLKVKDKVDSLNTEPTAPTEDKSPDQERVIDDESDLDELDGLFHEDNEEGS